jgi:hypothetical protein
MIRNKKIVSSFAAVLFVVGAFGIISYINTQRLITNSDWAKWTVACGIPLSLMVLAIAAIVLMRSGRSDDLIAGPPAEDNPWQRIVARYVFAVMLALLASLFRVWLLKLGPMPYFFTYYPAVLLVAMVSGGGPGIATTMLSALMVTYYFIPPLEQLAFSRPVTWWL